MVTQLLKKKKVGKALRPFADQIKSTAGCCAKTPGLDLDLCAQASVCEQEHYLLSHQNKGLASLRSLNVKP